MALKKLSKSYGTSYAGLSASLRDMQGQPARLYTSSTMTSVIPDGRLSLNSQGSFSVYVDDSKLYSLTIFGWDTGSVLLTDLNLEVDDSSPLTGKFFSSTGVLSSTSNLSETVLWQVTIPAGVVGKDSRIAIEAAFSCSPNTNSKTHRISIGQSISSSTTLFSRTRSSASHYGDVPLLLLASRGSVSAQVLATSASATYVSPSAAATSVYSIDFSQDQTVFFSGYVAVGTDYDRLELGSVRVDG